MTEIYERVDNVHAEVIGEQIVIKIDISREALERCPKTNDGKKRRPATTHGPIRILTKFGLMLLSLNVTMNDFGHTVRTIRTIGRNNE